MGMFSEIASEAATDAIVAKLYSRWWKAAEGERKKAFAEAIKDCSVGYEWDTSDSYKNILKEIERS